MRKTIIATILAALVMIPSTAAAGTTTKYSIKVTCYGKSSPERVVIRNNRSGSIKVTRITSTYKPTNSEPYRMSKTIKKGKSWTWKPSRAIFNNDRDDRVKVTTNKGTITARCN